MQIYNSRLSIRLFLPSPHPTNPTTLLPPPPSPNNIVYVNFMFKFKGQYRLCYSRLIRELVLLQFTNLIYIYINCYQPFSVTPVKLRILRCLLNVKSAWIVVHCRSIFKWHLVCMFGTVERNFPPICRDFIPVLYILSVLYILYVCRCDYLSMPDRIKIKTCQ